MQSYLNNVLSLVVIDSTHQVRSSVTVSRECLASSRRRTNAIESTADMTLAVPTRAFKSQLCVLMTGIPLKSLGRRFIPVICIIRITDCAPFNISSRIGTSPLFVRVRRLRSAAESQVPTRIGSINFCVYEHLSHSPLVIRIQ